MTQSLNDSGHNPLMMSAKELTVDLDEIMIEEKLSFNPLRKLIILVTLCGLYYRRYPIFVVNHEIVIFMTDF